MSPLWAIILWDTHGAVSAGVIVSPLGHRTLGYTRSSIRWCYRVPSGPSYFGIHTEQYPLVLSCPLWAIVLWDTHGAVSAGVIVSRLGHRTLGYTRSSIRWYYRVPSGPSYFGIHTEQYPLVLSCPLWAIVLWDTHGAVSAGVIVSPLGHRTLGYTRSSIRWCYRVPSGPSYFGIHTEQYPLVLSCPLWAIVLWDTHGAVSAGVIVSPLGHRTLGYTRSSIRWCYRVPSGPSYFGIHTEQYPLVLTCLLWAIVLWDTHGVVSAGVIVSPLGHRTLGYTRSSIRWCYRVPSGPSYFGIHTEQYPLVLSCPLWAIVLWDTHGAVSAGVIVSPLGHRTLGYTQSSIRWCYRVPSGPSYFGIHTEQYPLVLSCPVWAIVLWDTQGVVSAGIIVSPLGHRTLGYTRSSIRWCYRVPSGPSYFGIHTEQYPLVLSCPLWAIVLWDTHGAVSAGVIVSPLGHRTLGYTQSSIRWCYRVPSGPSYFGIHTELYPLVLSCPLWAIVLWDTHGAVSAGVIVSPLGHRTLGYTRSSIRWC